LGTLNEDPGSDVKLKIYALFKQATIGKCNTPKPSMVDFVNRAKWNAWSELSNLSQDEAEKQYISIVSELAQKEAPVQTKKTEGVKTNFECIQTSIECGNIYKIVLNRPAKLNALTVQMYRELIFALAEADADPNVLAGICLNYNKLF
jgi:Delta3-Delta2-enoyl-CoA isomerase